jgi:hypothetical protein
MTPQDATMPTTLDRWPAWRAGLALGGLALLAAVLIGSMIPPGDDGERLTRNTVRLSLAWYAAALVQMMRLSPADWTAATPRGRSARACWAWSIVCFLVHLAMAFHYYHHWSHAHAFEHTRATSGVGEGLYVSYLFTWLWIGDAAWWLRAPQSYAVRPAWIDRVLHGFMLFIVFNGMIVFESGPIRWAGVALFVALPLAWLAARGIPRRSVA